MRQCSSRYAIHAGRNLPDKEFRYLRTLIVRAAVYRSFGCGREPPSLTYRHRAGVRLYTSSYEFAESCVFSKQSPEPLCCDLLAEAPLIPKLRGNFAEFLNQRFPEHLRLLASPTCVSFSTVANVWAFLDCCSGNFVIQGLALAGRALLTARFRFQQCPPYAAQEY